MAVLGLRFCARAFSSCGEQGSLFITVRGPLTIVASLVAEHRLQTRRLSSCGSRAELLRGTWDLPRPGLEPVSPALAGRFSTTAPPGKPRNGHFLPKSPVFSSPALGLASLVLFSDCFDSVIFISELILTFLGHKLNTEYLIWTCVFHLQTLGGSKSTLQAFIFNLEFF